MATIKITTNADMTPETANKIFAFGLAVADTIVKYDDYKVRLGDLTVPGVHYLAANGFNQAMGDSVAGVESGKMSVPAAATEADGKRWAKFLAESKIAATDTTVADVTAAVVAARYRKRYDAIVASAIPAKDGGGDGRADPRTSWINKAALDEIKAKHDAKGREMPKGAELKALVAKYAAHESNAARLAKLWDERNARLAGEAEKTDEILGF